MSHVLLYFFQIFKELHTINGESYTVTLAAHCAVFTTHAFFITANNRLNFQVVGGG
jgi:hypothetical protein